jgi:restriction endonuclease S subunit
MRVRISTLVRQVNERVKVEPEKEYKMAGVKWYGEGVFHRETVRGDAMSANQVTQLVAGALIYNRLFAWKASFAVVPPGLADCYVSSEFPQFIPDAARILSEYLYLFCTREATIRAVNAASTGSSAVSRNRFKEEEFLNFEISLPPLAEQKAIIARWRMVQDEIAAALRRSVILECELQKHTRRALGIAETSDVQLPKVFALKWRDLSRWSVEFLGRQVVGLTGTETGKYSTYPLASLCDGVSGGTPSTRNAAYWNGSIPWVSPKDMKAGELFDSEDHISQLAIDEAVPLIPANSVLVVVRSGILQRIVPIAVNRVPVSINQDIRAFVPRDSQQLSSDFLAAYMEAQGQALLRLVKWSTTVQSINKEEIERFPVPLPPVPLQDKIAADVKARKQEIARKREAADRLVLEINSEIEALMLGTKTLREA